MSTERNKNVHICCVLSLSLSVYKRHLIFPDWIEGKSIDGVHCLQSQVIIGSNDRAFKKLPALLTKNLNK